MPKDPSTCALAMVRSLPQQTSAGCRSAGQWSLHQRPERQLWQKLLQGLVQSLPGRPSLSPRGHSYLATACMATQVARYILNPKQVPAAKHENPGYASDTHVKEALSPLAFFDSLHGCASSMIEPAKHVDSQTLEDMLVAAELALHACRWHTLEQPARPQSKRQMRCTAWHQQGISISLSVPAVQQQQGHP